MNVSLAPSWERMYYAKLRVAWGVLTIRTLLTFASKTAVFVLSVLQLLDKDNNDQVACLVLCHARELAFQIQQEFDRFKKYLPNVKTLLLVGGVPPPQDRQSLKEKKPQIVIGTPGRVFHMVEEKALILDNLKHFVLDECDEMLDSLSMLRRLFLLI